MREIKFRAWDKKAEKTKKIKKLSNEEIYKQYEHGIVNLMPMMENLIDRFKKDKTSLDIQQLQLVTQYLIIERELDEAYIEKLEKGE